MTNPSAKKRGRTWSMSWEYIAGFFDGEGSIDVREGEQPLVSGIGRKWFFRINMYQNDKIVLERIQSFLACEGFVSKIGKASGRDNYALTLTDMSNVARFLIRVEPLLIVKREQAILAIETLFLLTEDFLAGKLDRRQSWRYAQLREVFNA